MEIRRDIYVLRDRIKDPIEYVQGSDKIQIIFTLKDYDIPAGASMRLYVEKPSGKAVYNTVTGAIKGNVITINPTKQMSAETGVANIQVELIAGGKSLVTFAYPMRVKRSLFKISSDNGSNFIDELMKKVQAAIDYIEDLGKKLTDAAQSGKFSATVQVGDTSTLPPGSEAVVSNSGTKKDAVFNFGIPKGEQGNIGPIGPQGKQGERGPKGEPGADGTAVVIEVKPGMFALSISAEGHLIVTHNAADEAPPLKIVDGHLKYIIGGTVN